MFQNLIFQNCNDTTERVAKNSYLSIHRLVQCNMHFINRTKPIKSLNFATIVVNLDEDSISKLKFTKFRDNTVIRGESEHFISFNVKFV